MDDNSTPVVMSECNVSYDNSNMIYTVTFQSKQGLKIIPKQWLAPFWSDFGSLVGSENHT